MDPNPSNQFRYTGCPTWHVQLVVPTKCSLPSPLLFLSRAARLTFRYHSVLLEQGYSLPVILQGSSSYPSGPVQWPWRYTCMADLCVLASPAVSYFVEYPGGIVVLYGMYLIAALACSRRRRRQFGYLAIKCFGRHGIVYSVSALTAHAALVVFHFPRA